MKIKQSILTGLCLLFVWTAQAQTQVIAHRGFWKTEGSAQNSITGLQKAAEAGVYGSEFDVQLTADGVVVVNHDDVVEGLVIGETKYEKLKDIKLKNGERIPLLEEYLKTGKQLPEIRLVLEIKPHKTQSQENQIAAVCVRLVKKYGMEKQVEYISFSMNICEQLVSLAPDAEVAYLNGDCAPKDIKAKGLTGIDYSYKVFYKHPEWVKEAQSLGLKVNVWTVNKTADLQKMIAMGVDLLTTDQVLEAKEMVSGREAR